MAHPKVYILNFDSAKCKALESEHVSAGPGESKSCRRNHLHRPQPALMRRGAQFENTGQGAAYGDARTKPGRDVFRLAISCIWRNDMRQTGKGKSGERNQTKKDASARRISRMILSAVLIAADTFTVFGDSFPRTGPKDFVPNDQRSVGGIYYQNNMALIYQYRIDFFHNVGPSEAKKIGQETGRRKPSPVKPFKSMTFQQRLNWDYPSRSVLATEVRTDPVPAVAVCTDPTIPYSSNDPEESAIVGRGGIIAHNPKGEFHDFCGVIDADGTIAAQVPWKLPIYEPLGISSDGKEALFGAGHMGMAGKDADYPELLCQYFIHWTYPNKIEKIDVQKLSNKEFHAMEDKFGFVVAREPDVHEHAIK